MAQTTEKESTMNLNDGQIKTNDRKTAEDKMKNYYKELTIALGRAGGENIKEMELMKTGRQLCEGIMACRRTGEVAYEITMSQVEGKD